MSCIDIIVVIHTPEVTFVILSVAVVRHGKEKNCQINWESHLEGILKKTWESHLESIFFGNWSVEASFRAAFRPAESLSSDSQSNEPCE